MPPQRIACLSEEPTEILYHLGEQNRIVGITAYTVRPPRAAREKPVVSRFVEAEFDAIVALAPDLVFTFSDLQAEIAAGLIRRGIAVHAFNQRSIDDIYEVVRTVAAIVGRSDAGEAYVSELREQVEVIRRRAGALPRRPRVYFEEWPKPLITASQWVAELIDVAGGEYVFPELCQGKTGRERMLADPTEILRRRPDLFLASWCGAKFKAAAVRRRPGWGEAEFVRRDRLVEIPSEIILQAGPAALTDGLEALYAIIAAVAREP